jgi:hypothetical protein
MMLGRWFESRPCYHRKPRRPNRLPWCLHVISRPLYTIATFRWPELRAARHRWQEKRDDADVAEAGGNRKKAALSHPGPIVEPDRPVG